MPCEAGPGLQQPGEEGGPGDRDRSAEATCGPVGDGLGLHSGRAGPCERRGPGTEAPVAQRLSVCLSVCPCCLWAAPSAPVLSIHKLPASGATDISFPMKGWRATGDWAKVPEDRVTVSKSVFSTGLAGEGPLRETQALGSEGPAPTGFLLESDLRPQGPALHSFLLSVPEVTPSSRKPSLPFRLWEAPGQPLPSAPTGPVTAGREGVHPEAHGSQRWLQRREAHPARPPGVTSGAPGSHASSDGCAVCVTGADVTQEPPPPGCVLPLLEQGCG